MTNNDITYHGFNLSKLIRDVFPQCSISLHVHNVSSLPYLIVNVKPGMHSDILLQMGHDYIMGNIIVPIYQSTGKAPLLLNIIVSPEDQWHQDGYNEYDTKQALTAGGSRWADRWTALKGDG